MKSKQKAVWITGASSGIGKSLSVEFAKNGKNLILTSRKNDALERVKKEINNPKISVETIAFDISVIDEIEKNFETISKNYEIECLINNAGVTSFSYAAKDTVSQIKNIIDTNLLGSIYMIKTVLPGMINRKKGTIINIQSVAAKKVFTKSSAYAASKAGLSAYSQVLREELREHNIRVIDVYPGATKTPIWPNDALEKYSDRMMSPDEISKFIFNAYSVNSNMVTEELVIRPMKGDL
ncbi:MAG: SDR family NAD(P)-dependent oxidoreductase [Bacteroidetes bacterium]|nr:SDR family NAD(P)-dependent oxidoreductase [Bacteroidota bacterium]